MTIGASGSYGVNGTDFTLQPTSGRWIPQSPVAFTGDGHPIYPAVHEFQLRWSDIEQSDLNQLQNFRDSVILTGTATVDLPAYRSASYIFTSYTGCSIYEPERGDYFTETTLEYSLVVGNIHT